MIRKHHQEEDEPRAVRGRPRRNSKSGGVVIIGGPDGSGKTTLCARLIADVLSGKPVLHIRFPRLLPRRNREKARARRLGGGNSPDASTARIYPPSYPRGLSIAKASYLYLDFLLGWVVRVAPFVRRGGWVVFERGWWDHAVDPRRYRLRSGRPFELLGRLLPRADVVFVLETDPEIIRARKPQLSSEELTRQMTAWHQIMPSAQQTVFLDAASPMNDLVDQVGAQLRALRSGAFGDKP